MGSLTALFVSFAFATMFFVTIQGSQPPDLKTKLTCYRVSGMVGAVFSRPCAKCIAVKGGCNTELAKIGNDIVDCCKNIVDDVCKKAKCLRTEIYKVSQKKKMAQSCFGVGKPCGPYPLHNSLKK